MYIMKPIITLSLTQINHLLMEIIEIVNIAKFTANVSINLQVKICAADRFLALSQNRNETRSNSSAQVVGLPGPTYAALNFVVKIVQI